MLSVDFKMAVLRCWTFVCIVICRVQISIASDCPPQPYDIPGCGLNNTCPTTSPLLNVHGSIKGCVNECGPGEIVRDTLCIDVEKCDRPIVDDGHCLKMCPEGFVYFPDSYRVFFSYLSGKKTSDGTLIFKHTTEDKYHIRCRKAIHCVAAISLFLGIACLWSLILYCYLHPRPCCVVKVSQCIRRWKQRKKTQMERPTTASAAATVDDDEPLLNVNHSVQNLDDEVILV